jgi:NADPH-dependent curcumin reductase CurA
MQGGTVGEVVESRNPRYAVGDKVVGMGGWQEYSVVDGDAARRAAQGGHHPCAAEPLPGRGGHARRDRLVRPGENH